MKFRNLSILFIFVLGILIMVFCKPEPAEERLLQTADQIIEKMVFSEDLEAELKLKQIQIEEQKQNIANEIIKVRDTLIKDFARGNYKGMGDLLESKSAILEGRTLQYTRIYGSTAIEAFFAEAKEAKELELKITHVFVDSIVEERQVDETPEGKVDRIARGIFNYHILTRQGGETLKNQGGGFTFEFLHRQNCPWDG